MRAALIAGAAGLVLGGLLVGLAQQARIDGLRERLGAAAAQAWLLEQENASCVADVAAVREGWAAYRQLQSERQDRVAAELAAAQGAADAAQRRARDLSSRPPAAGPECAAVSDLVREYRGGRQ